MNEDESIREAPASAEETDAARRLADAIDSGAHSPEEGEPTAVVHLFETISRRDFLDDIQRQRLRKELLAAPSRSRDRILKSLTAAAMVTVAVGTLFAVLIWRSPGSPSPQTLADRERLAREAFASVAGLEALEHRQAWIYDQQWGSRLDSALENQRYSLLTGYVSGSSSMGASQPAQNPGGTS